MADVPALDVLKGTKYRREVADDPDRREWCVPKRWTATVPLDKAVKKIGLFGNQDTVCRPTTPKWRTTVNRLQAHFPGFDG